jgi:hypothetical protein
LGTDTRIYRVIGRRKRVNGERGLGQGKMHKNTCKYVIK